MKKIGKKILPLLFFLSFVSTVPLFVFAQRVVLDAGTFTPRVSVTLSPKSGTFVEGSTFDVPIILNTKGISINGVEVRIGFDQEKLLVVQPSSGQSIIGVWVEPPAYDNARGTASYVGVIPNGIVTEAGLVGTITFKAKALGKAVVTVRSSSNILLNDGSGTPAVVDYGRSEYNIIPKPPEGVTIYSETHPFSGDWYNNNNPVFLWDRDPGVTGFSYVLDDKPTTIPENTITTNETIKSYEKLADGLKYFHVKAFKNGVWGNPGHFLVRIDTNPPAEFTPKVNYVLAATILTERALVSFFTTDNLSGLSHYEVGVIDTSQPLTESPVFVQTESPYQIEIKNKAGLKVIVRAVDKAGNIRESFVDVKRPFGLTKFFEDNLVYLLMAIIFVLVFSILFHYLFGRHILSRLKRAIKMVKEEKVESTNIVTSEAEKIVDQESHEDNQKT
mgnify:CR=1 FL=1